MAIPRKQLKKAILQALIKAVQRTGEGVFDLSQSTTLCYVPTVTGTLKKSGYSKMLRNGIEIGYSSPYSARVERGGPAIPYTGTQVIHIRAHKRSGYTKKDGTYVQPTQVKAHEVRYNNKRLIGFRPKHSKFEFGPLIFRVMKEEPARKGQFFLTRAFDEGIKKLPENIRFVFSQIRSRGVA